MVLFFNSFISYLIIVLISMGIIVLAVILGKKWRDAKDQKEASKQEQSSTEDQNV